MTVRAAIEQAIREVKPGLDHEVVFKLASGLVGQEENNESCMDDLVPMGCEKEAVAFFKACLTGEPVVECPGMDVLVKKFRREGKTRTLRQAQLN
jgi:hypothetical protein